MAQPIAAITATVADSVDPVVEVERLVLVELHVDAAEANFVTVDAREVGLAGDPRSEAGVERVVPDVEFPDRRRIDRA